MLHKSAILIFVFFFTATSVFGEVRLSLDGLSGPLQKRLLDALEPPPLLKAEGPVNRLWLARYLKQLPSLTHSILEPFGYYHAEIRTTQRVEGDQVQLQVHIDPGPPVRVVERSISFAPRGTTERPEIQLDSFSLKIGDVLQEDLYEKGKAVLLGQLQDQGFLDARFSHRELRVDRDLNRAAILLEIAPGERSRFGAVHFSGAEEYPERFLRRYLVFDPGEPFSYRLLGKTQKNLRDSDLFRKILVVPELKERQGREMPVLIKLEPRRRFSLRPGVGYGTDTGARVSLRYLDRNAWQRGHRFNLDLLLAERLQDFSGSYAFPGYRNLNTGLNLHGGYRAEHFDNYTSRYVFSEVEQTYGFAENRLGALFARVQFEKSDITADSVYTGFLMPGIRFSAVRIPTNSDKNYGYRLQGEARISDERLLSKISLVQLLGSAGLFLKLPWRTRLSLRGEVASTFIDNPFAEIPASLRFFAGGDSSVRGYAYQSLGPKDDTGKAVGGKHLLTGSVELGKLIGQKWGLALFVDSGNAFDSWKDYALEMGAGIGLRYETPVGPLRVDLASPVGNGHYALRLHVGIGFGW